MIILSTGQTRVKFTVASQASFQSQIIYQLLGFPVEVEYTAGLGSRIVGSLDVIKIGAVPDAELSV